MTSDPIMRWKQDKESEPTRGEEFSSINPATGEIVWTGQMATPQDVHVAVERARAALPEWARRTPEERAELLLRFRDQLTQQKEDLAKLISREVGKALWDAGTEVQAMIGKVDVSLRFLRERRAPRELGVSGGRGTVRYKPHGVMAVFGPFNFPGHIANGQIVPALAAGNVVLFKPSELSPGVAEATVRIWEQAGLPPGVLTLLQGAKETGAALVQHPGVNGVLFTGSLKTGIALRTMLLEQPEKILVLELGGNNPLVIHRPEDLRAAVYWTIQSAFITGGQRCTCARRLIVTEGNEEFLKLLIESVRQIRIGSPDGAPQPFFGPLVNPQAVDQVLWGQQRLLDSGGEVLLKAERLSLGSAYVSPGLIDLTSCHVRSDQEIFGPLLQVIRVPDLSAAIQEANRTQYGLVSALFTRDRADFERFYDEARAGLINWNRPTTGASSELPFGGVGRSGNHRPAGAFAVDFCNIPVATLESESLALPEQFSPGVTVP